MFITKRLDPMAQSSTNGANHQPVNYRQIQNAQISKKPEKGKCQKRPKLKPANMPKKKPVKCVAFFGFFTPNDANLRLMDTDLLKACQREKQ